MVMTAKADISGVRFGYLVAVESVGRDSTGKTVWSCVCDCGSRSNATALNLKSGNTKSCGCMKHPKGAANKRTITDISRIKERKRSFAAHRWWRNDVLKRNPCCLKCGVRDRLQAHHLYGYADYPERRIDPGNGATLCSECHLSFHIQYGRKTGFTEDDFREFIVGFRDCGLCDDAGIYELNPMEEEIIKYVTRYKSKGGVKDLEKAKHFIDLLIELESGRV